MTEPLFRSLEFERGVTQQACKGVCDPSELLDQAQRRAQTLSGEYVTDPRLIAPGRNRRREGRQEIEDCLNHLLWDTQEHLADEERAQENLIAIRFIALAYARIQERD